MLHLPAQPSFAQPPLPYSEALSRLASVRHALRLVEPFAGGPASDLSDDEAIASRWDGAGEARQHLFDRRSSQTVGAAAAGLEALLIEREAGREPAVAASTELVDQIRQELEALSTIILG